MTVHERLILSSLHTLTLLGLISLTIELLVPPLWPVLPITVPFVALLCVALLTARSGRVRVAAALSLGLGGIALLGAVVVTGGPESRLALFLPLVTMVAWGWLGRRVGIAAIVVVLLALVGSWAFGPGPSQTESDGMLILASVAAVVFGAGLLSTLTSDLKGFAEETWRRAAHADAAATAALAADEARDRFLAQVSHDLRTPLDVVVGYTELIGEDETDPERRADLARIRSAAFQLLALLDDILELTRNQMNDEIVPEPFEMGVLIDEVVDTTAAVVTALGKRLVVRMADPGAPVLSDRRRIRQVLINLVSNAAKYSQGPEILLEVAQCGSEAVWAVRDSGRGLSSEQLSRLFQPFVQLHEGTERRAGVGLGLALSQRIAARLGGRIEATSQPGVGSIFTLRLPLRVPDRTPSRRSRSGASPMPRTVRPVSSEERL